MKVPMVMFARIEIGKWKHDSDICKPACSCLTAFA